MAQMLYDMGIVKENKLIEVERKDLIANYIGQTATKTAEVIESAKNGVLFIDEAYELAKGKGLEAAGLAMHVLADTWAHRHFAGTPSLSVNNTNYYFYEIIPDGEGYTERSVAFNHNPSSADDIERGRRIFR